MKINIKKKRKKKTKFIFELIKASDRNGWYFIIAMENWINCLINYWLEFSNETKLNEKSMVKTFLYVCELLHDSSEKFLIVQSEI